MPTKVKIDPGICKLPTSVTATLINEDEVQIKVNTACDSVRAMIDELGDTYDTFEVCLQKPGCGPFYDYAKEHFPVHVSCPAINGIIKAMEVEGKLALPCDAEIKFVYTPFSLAGRTELIGRRVAYVRKDFDASNTESRGNAAFTLLDMRRQATA